MTRSELKKLITDGETVHLECKLAKTAIPANFWETYSSFANTDGGTILLGVKEENHKFSVVGVDDARKILTDFWNTVHGDKVSAVVVYEHDVRIETVGGKQIVVVEVPRSDRVDKPVYVGEDVYKGTFRRNGEGDYRCSREDVTAMIRDSCAETADATVLDELEVSDLDQDSLRRYRILFDNLRPEHVWRRLEDEAFLVKIGAAKKLWDGSVHPTLVGLVCFGDFNEITNVLSYFFLDYREHLSPNVRWTDRVCSGDANWSGNIFDFFFRINQSITAGVKVPFKIASDNVTRDDDTPVHKALREVLANALIHADYHGRRGIVIDKYPKRLEVSNPGTLRMSKSVAIAGGTSDARNGKIFNIFSLVRIGERSGMGLSSPYGVWEKEKFAEPSIIENYEPDRTKVMVEFEADDSELGAKTPEVGVETAELGVGKPEVGVETAEVGVKNRKMEVHPDFDVLMGAYRNDFRTNARRVLSILVENPEMDFVHVAKMLNISENSVWRSVRALREVGLLVREGADKGGRWIVKK